MEGRGLGVGGRKGFCGGGGVKEGREGKGEEWMGNGGKRTGEWSKEETLAPINFRPAPAVKAIILLKSVSCTVKLFQSKVQ